MLVGDFLSPLGELTETIEGLSARGARGHLVHGRRSGGGDVPLRGPGRCCTIWKSACRCASATPAPGAGLIVERMARHRGALRDDPPPRLDDDDAPNRPPGERGRAAACSRWCPPRAGRRSAREPPDAAAFPSASPRRWRSPPWPRCRRSGCCCAITPPQPRRIDFPPLRIMLDLLPERETPARTPWWLLLMRLAIAGAADRRRGRTGLEPRRGRRPSGPLLVLVDNGFTAAHDWRDRVAARLERIDAAERDGGRVVARRRDRRPAADIQPLAAGGGAGAAARLKPRPYLPDRRAHLAPLAALPRRDARRGDRLDQRRRRRRRGPSFQRRPGARDGDRPLTVLKTGRAPALALAGIESAAGQLAVRVVRAEPNGRDAGRLARARPQETCRSATRSFAFPAGATETSARFDLPIDIRNAIARIEILGEGSAGAVTLRRRARQAPPRRARLRRDRRSGAAAARRRPIT